MKKTILLIGMVIISLSSFAIIPPAAVQKAFEQKFPNTSKLKWDKENAHEYEASFEWNGKNCSANFSDSGEWLETESQITFSDLPDKVQKAYTISHKEAKIKAVTKIETSKGITKYEVKIKQGIKIVELLYTEDGTILKE